MITRINLGGSVNDCLGFFSALRQKVIWTSTRLWLEGPIDFVVMEQPFDLAENRGSSNGSRLIVLTKMLTTATKNIRTTSSKRSCVNPTLTLRYESEYTYLHIVKFLVFISAFLRSKFMITRICLDGSVNDYISASFRRFVNRSCKPRLEGPMEFVVMENSTSQ